MLTSLATETGGRLWLARAHEVEIAGIAAGEQARAARVVSKRDA
jgi:hypothetical protein